MNLGNNIIPKIMQVCIYSCFHFITLEEYYSGYLYFPPLNAVSDGSIFIIGASLLTACLGGTNFLATPMFSGEWLGWDGVVDLTIGQITALVISIMCGSMSFW